MWKIFFFYLPHLLHLPWSSNPSCVKIKYFNWTGVIGEVEHRCPGAGLNLVSCSLLYPACEIKSTIPCHISQLRSEPWPPAILLLLTSQRLIAPTKSPLHLFSLLGGLPSELKSTSQLHFDLWPSCFVAPASQSGHNLTCHSLTSLLHSGLSHFSSTLFFVSLIVQHTYMVKTQQRQMGRWHDNWLCSKVEWPKIHWRWRNFGLLELLVGKSCISSTYFSLRPHIILFFVTMSFVWLLIF